MAKPARQIEDLSEYDKALCDTWLDCERKLVFLGLLMRHTKNDDPSYEKGYRDGLFAIRDSIEDVLEIREKGPISMPRVIGI